MSFKILPTSAVFSLCALLVLAIGQTLLLAEQELPAAKPSERIILQWHQGDGASDWRLAAVALRDKSMQWLTGRLPLDSQPFVGPVVVSPNGKLAAYGAVGPDRTDGLAVFNFWLRPVDDPNAAGEKLGVHGQMCCWSPDGNELLITHIEDDYTISYTFVDAKSKQVRSLSLPKVERPREVTGPLGYYVTDWSRDGRWLLANFYAGKDPAVDKPHLVLLKSDGSEARRVGHVPSGIGGQFSPDGRHILYTGSHEHEGKTTLQLFVVGIDGGQPVRVSQELDGDIHGYAWSPDSQRIAYVWFRWASVANEQHETFLMSVTADGKNPQTLFSDKSSFGARFRSPNWR